MYNSISLDIFPTKPLPSLRRVLTQTSKKLNDFLSGNYEMNASFLSQNKELILSKFDWKEEFDLYTGTLLRVYHNDPNDYFGLNYYILSEEYPMGMASSGNLEYMLDDLRIGNTRGNIPCFEGKYKMIRELDSVINLEAHHQKTSSLSIFFLLICAIELGKLCEGIFGPECLVSSQMLLPCDTNEFWSQLTKEKEFENLVNTIEKETSEKHLLTKCKRH